jgi:acyl carrier protein
MKMEGILEKVRSFIINNFLFGDDGTPLDNEASLLDQGIIDSTGVLELVEWIEETFHLSTTDDDLIPENLDGVNKLVCFVERKINLNKSNG